MSSRQGFAVTAFGRLVVYLAAGVTALMLLWSLPERLTARGQEPSGVQEVAEPAVEPIPPADHPPAGEPAAIAVPAKPPDNSINVFALAVAGGIFMIPIAGMSLLAMTMTIERLIGLRTQRVVPPRFVEGIEHLAGGSGGFETRKALRLCQQYPSAAANVIRMMLMKAGRPLAEAEAAAAQASQREADRLYANVRWLNMAASLSTMLGLIGTIQGMIMAFHRLTITDAATDRTTVLADGIYTALVTTFAGLAVAIPTLLASHYFESRILSQFRQIDDLALQLSPQLERLEVRGAARDDSMVSDAS